VQQQLATRIEELEKQTEIANELQSKLREESRKRLAAALAKPPYFEGKIAGSSSDNSLVRDWVGTVKRYVATVGFADAEAVQFAASYLRGAALAAWNLRATALAAAKEPVTLEAFSETLIKRFGGPSEAEDARKKLDKLQQTGKFAPLRSYLSEFEKI
jgi:hypothetical protein